MNDVQMFRRLMDIRRLGRSVLDIHFTDNACYVMNSSLFYFKVCAFMWKFVEALMSQ